MVKIKTQLWNFLVTNSIFRVIMTSKRVYQTSSVLQTVAFNADFDIDRVSHSLRGAVDTPVGTSVSWSFSSGGGTTWMPIEPNALVPTNVPQWPFRVFRVFRS